MSSARRVVRIAVRIAVVLFLLVFGHWFYLDAYRPVEPDSTAGYIHQTNLGGGYVVYLSNLDKVILNWGFVIPFTIFAIAIYIDRRGRRENWTAHR